MEKLTEKEFKKMRTLGMLKQRLLELVNRIQFEMDCLDYLIRERSRKENEQTNKN